jgi:hypothetical protein
MEPTVSYRLPICARGWCILVGVDAARVEELQEKRRALAREAKRLILDRRPTTTKRAELARLLRAGEAIDAELERAFYAPDPGT